jgi:hypothetical protein
MKRVLEIAFGIFTGVFMVGTVGVCYEKYTSNQREIERLKKRLDVIDKQLECLEVIEEEVDD